MANPLPGIATGYLIIGSDKRGAIYGMYEHSEQAGMSPWYYWADVPAKQHTELHAVPCAFGPPPVKYRGICMSSLLSRSLTVNASASFER